MIMQVSCKFLELNLRVLERERQVDLTASLTTTVEVSIELGSDEVSYWDGQSEKFCERHWRMTLS